MTDTDQRLAAIVAAGKLRVGLFPSFFYSKDRDTGVLSGWGIEMANALALHLGVAPHLIERASPPDVVTCLRIGECDVAFLGISAARAAEVDFTPSWAQADFTFLVHGHTAIACLADVDRPATRIGVVANHAMDSALDGKLRHAQRVYADTPDAAFALFQSGAVDILAGIRPGLVGYAARAPGTRVLADRYGANVIALAVAKGETGWLAHASAFVAERKRNGTAKAAVVRAGATGLEVLA